MKILFLVLAVLQLLIYWKKSCLLKAFFLNVLAVLLLFACSYFGVMPLREGSLFFVLFSGFPGVMALYLLPWI